MSATGDAAPSFASFTVNGETMPSIVETASAVTVEAEIDDPDGDVAYIVFRRDGETISTQDGPGSSFSFEWVVSGAEFNGSYVFDAEVYDSNDNLASSEAIELPVGMPASGEVEAWSHDSGEIDRAHDIWVDTEGESVIITGQTTVVLQGQIRTDRVTGPVWEDKTDESALSGNAIAKRDAGGYFVAGGTSVGMDSSDTALLHYSDDGELVEVVDANITNQFGEDYDFAIDVGPTPGGAVLLGFYRPSGGANAGEWRSYVRRYTNNFDIEYTRFPSEELTGNPTAFGLSAIEDGSFVLGGGRFSEQLPVPWLGRFDATGELIDEIALEDVDAGFFNAVHQNEDGSFVVGGQLTTGLQTPSWLQSYDAQGELEFELSIPDSGIGIVTAVAVDAWGEILAVSTEHCTLEGIAYRDCELVVRKFESDGTQMWEEVYETSFLGPEILSPGLNASVTTDRYGYIYVTAVTDSPAGSDWWARKLHP